MSYFYRFGLGSADGGSEMKNMLGGKGANLAEMAKMGMPIPPGITISTEACKEFLACEHPADFTDSLMDMGVNDYLIDMEDHFGYMPLFSVRSGARVSMPGMMDTLLNVGITLDNITEWRARIGVDAANDCLRRAVTMFAKVVKGVDLPETTYLKSLLNRYEKIVGEPYPANLSDLLRECIAAVFRSWNSERAIHYRKMHGYPNDWGTAVNIQVMVFGNKNDKSCSGVLFTCDPATGSSTFTGDFIVGAQGEDVVAGTHNTLPIDHLPPWNGNVATQLYSAAKKLEEHYKYPQDIEFTVQDGELYILQTRNAKMSARAEFSLAHNRMVSGEDLKKVKEMLCPRKYLSLSETAISPSSKAKPDCEGKPAGGSVVKGKAMFSSAAAVKCKEATILVRRETTPEDIAGMDASVGILTSTGGNTSHAAVVARGLGKTCVVGCTSLGIKYDDSKKTSLANGHVIKEGDEIVIDGKTGAVYATELPDLIDGAEDPCAEEIIETLAKGLPYVGIGTKWRDRIDGFLVVPVREFDHLPDDEMKKALRKVIRELRKANKKWAKRVVFDLAPSRMVDRSDYMRFLTCSKQSYVDTGLTRNVEMLSSITKSVNRVWITCSKGLQEFVGFDFKDSNLSTVELDLEAIRKVDLVFKVIGG